jgi:hypothetical protein
MEILDIQQTSSTPRIYFDTGNNTLYVSGESYPENSFEFYAPVLSMVKENLESKKGLRIDINVSYMNSSSTKCILDMLDILEEAHQRGGKVSVTWRYDKDNPRSLDLAEEFRDEVSFLFTTVEI